jgi:hypothetical protein
MTANEVVDVILRDRQETAALEVKGPLPVIKANPTETEKDIVSIANSTRASEGWLIFGITKNFELVGMVGLDLKTPLTQLEKESCKQRFSQLAASAKPTAVLYDWNVIERQGKELAAVRIKGRQRGQFYQTSNGQTPYRVGDHTYLADANQIRQWIEEPHAEEPTDPAFALAIMQIGIYLVSFSWFTVWILGQSFASVIGLVGGSAVVISVVAYAKSFRIEQVLAWSRRTFPIFFAASILCVVASVGLQYTLTLYPLLSGLAFETYLTDIPRVSLYLLLATVIGGVLFDLPRLSSNEIRTAFAWVRKHRRFLLKTVSASLLILVACSSLAPIDAKLVLFTPKVGFVETRYLTDGVMHIYQIGYATFGAWSQNQEIVHIMMPLFPLVSESYYSFVTNSTKPPSILSVTGLSVSSPTEDSEGRIVVKLTTDSTSTSSPQFSVQFYSEFDISQLAHIYFSPRIFIQNFPNGTQQLQQQFSIVNYSAYDLRLDHIVLYEGGHAPTNQTLNFSPLQTFPQPYVYYDNNTRTFAIYGSVYQYGNLTAIVTYNSY